MKYTNSVIENNEDIILLIERYDLDKDSLEWDVSYTVPKDAKLYDNVLTLTLEDENQHKEITLGNFYLSDMKENLGVNYINKDFDKELFDLLNEYIFDRKC